MKASLTFKFQNEKRFVHEHNLFPLLSDPLTMCPGPFVVLCQQNTKVNTLLHSMISVPHNSNTNLGSCCLVTKPAILVLLRKQLRGEDATM